MATVLKAMAQALRNTEQAADFLGISKRTLEDWRTRGCGPRYRKHGHKVFYAEQALAEWSEGNEHQSTSEQATL